MFKSELYDFTISLVFLDIFWLYRKIQTCWDKTKIIFGFSEWKYIEIWWSDPWRRQLFFLWVCV